MKRARGSIAELIERAAGGQKEDLRADRTAAATAILAPVQEYPRQWAALVELAGATLGAVNSNRRAGKTYGLGALAESRLINRDNYVVRVITHRLAGPTNNWLDADGKESFLERLARLDMLDHATIKRAGDGSIKSIRFSWGSALYVHQFAGQGDIDDKHGFTADLYLADEAQYLDLLPLVLRQLVLPTLADSGGQVVLAGTPGREVGSFFHRSATGDDAGWTRCRFYSWHNPVFGDHFEQRWHRIVDTILAPSRALYGLTSIDIERLRALTEVELEWIAGGFVGTEKSRARFLDDTPGNPPESLDGTDPNGLGKTGESLRNASSENSSSDQRAEGLRKWVASLDSELRRQYLGQWVVGGADYVFEWHRAPNPLYWCRTASCRWNERDELKLPVADTIADRVALLPKRHVHGRANPRAWTAVLGVDIGWKPSSTSIVVLVWSSGLDLCYVLWSEAAFEQPDDVTLARIADIVGELKANGVNVHGVKADLAMRLGTGATWDQGLQRRFQNSKSWIEPFNKANKEQQIRAVNLDLRRGKYRLIAGDALDIEGRHLQWKPFDPESPSPPIIDKWRSVTLPSGRTDRPSDHCLDALRGAGQEVPALFKEVEQRGPLTESEKMDEIYAEMAKAEGMRHRQRM